MNISLIVSPWTLYLPLLRLDLICEHLYNDHFAETGRQRLGLLEILRTREFLHSAHQFHVEFRVGGHDRLLPETFALVVLVLAKKLGDLVMFAPHGELQGPEGGFPTLQPYVEYLDDFQMTVRRRARQCREDHLLEERIAHLTEELDHLYVPMLSNMCHHIH